MILDATNLNLQAVLTSSVTSFQPEVHVIFLTYNNDGLISKPALFRTELNHITEVNILAAPTTQGFVKEATQITIFNRDSASALVTVKTNDGTTQRRLIRQTLLTNESLIWEKQVGWYLHT